MSFKDFLRDLVASVEGAEGAIFLDEDGEAVEYYAPGDADRLLLRSACVAPMVKAARSVAKEVGTGELRQLVIVYAGASLVLEELEMGYFLLLEMAASANLGEAMYRMKPTASKLLSEMVK